MTINSWQSDLTNSADYAADHGTPSPHLPSSNMDRAHRVGLWAREHGIIPLEVRPGRGHKLILNRDYVLDFGPNENVPVVSKRS